MSGEKFIQKIVELGIPGAEKLESSDYDWLFIRSEENSPLIDFLEWFFMNTHPGDVLSTEEINQYNELERKGLVVSGQQLDSIASCLATLPSDDEMMYNTSVDAENEEIIAEDISLLEDQLNQLKLRRDQLNLHKLELKSELIQCKDRIHRQENSLGHKQQELLLTSSCHAKSLLQLSQSVDNFANFFKNFKNVEKETVYLSQLSLMEWHNEEEKFQANLKTYINKQFKEGVGEVVGHLNTSDYKLLEADSLDLQLVRGSDQQEYLLNCKELERLNIMLEHSEHDRVKADINLVRKKMEVQETEKIMNQTMRSQLPSSLQLIKANIAEIKESRKAVEIELHNQIDNLLKLSSQVSQCEATRTISGNYQVKLQRQEYFLQKQKYVLSELVKQLTRYDWMNVVLNLEDAAIDDALEAICGINELLQTNNNNYIKRLEILDTLAKNEEIEEVTGVIPPSLLLLKQLLQDSSQTDQSQEKNEKIQENLNKLNSEIKSLKYQLNALRDPHSVSLHKINIKCKFLEGCLYGNTETLTSLPSEWIDSKLISRRDKINENAYQYRLKMLAMLQKYEEKKKVLEVDPTHLNKMYNWANCKNVKP